MTPEQREKVRAGMCGYGRDLVERPWRSRRTEGSRRAPRPPPSQTGPVLRQHHGDRVQRRPDVAYGMGPAVYLLTSG